MKPVLFLHFHKSGGTTINHMFRGVLRKFPKNKNGNPHNANGVIPFWNFHPKKFSNFYQNVRRKNIQFLAMEWNFFTRRIPWKKFHFLTVVRDPYERFISNMNVDKAKNPHNYMRRNIIITRKRKLLVSFNKPNYYVRMLNGLGAQPDAVLTTAHLEKAKRVLSKFHTVVILEMKPSFRQLTSLGLPQQKLSMKSNKSSRKTYFMSKPDFEKRNQLDRKLYLFAKKLVQTRVTSS